MINQFLRYEPIQSSNIAIAAVLTTLLAIVITFLGIKLYEGERIING